MVATNDVKAAGTEDADLEPPLLSGLTEVRLFAGGVEVVLRLLADLLVPLLRLLLLPVVRVSLRFVARDFFCRLVLGMEWGASVLISWLGLVGWAGTLCTAAALVGQSRC